MLKTSHRGFLPVGTIPVHRQKYDWKIREKGVRITATEIILKKITKIRISKVCTLGYFTSSSLARLTTHHVKNRTKERKSRKIIWNDTNIIQYQTCILVHSYGISFTIKCNKSVTWQLNKKLPLPFYAGFDLDHRSHLLHSHYLTLCQNSYMHH